jgi:putative phosphoribosyl transferase
MFRNRLEAGFKLAELLQSYSTQAARPLAIPRGGIEVGYPIALRLKEPLDVIIPRKIPSPDNPELAIGAVTLDGSIELDQELIENLGLTPTDVKELVRPVQFEIERRLAAYRGSRPEPALRGKNVILIDDGLATGYTMMAAIKSVRRESPERVIVAVPVSPKSTYERLKGLADELTVVHLAPNGQFAVSAFYEDFRDLRDDELVRLLKDSCHSSSN